MLRVLDAQPLCTNEITATVQEFFPRKVPGQAESEGSKCFWPRVRPKLRQSDRASGETTGTQAPDFRASAQTLKYPWHFSRAEKETEIKGR